MESLFGSGSPVWTAMPSTGFDLQSPVRLGNGPSVAAAFPAMAGTAPAALTAPALLTAVAMRRGQPQGPTNDQDVEEFIFDAFELLAGTADIEVRCDGGKVTMTGTVSHKRAKRDAGEIAWAIPAVNDVQNNVTIQSRRRTRPAGRETETPQTGSGRKQG
jgi:BON domain-containing protein